MSGPRHQNLHESNLDYRARMERSQYEAEERRSRALTDQRSPENSDEVRVRLWESLHQVRMPRSPQHAVLKVIAQQTGLTLAEVQQVQGARAHPAQHP